MGFDNVTFWLFLAATVVASFTFVTIIVWAENRLKERQEYYRFEFRKKLVEAGKIDGAAMTSLVRYEHEIGLRKGREKLLVAAFVIAGAGVGICVGLQFIGNSVWMVGLIPLCIGLSMLLYGLVIATKPDPGPPPLGWSPESSKRE